MTPVRLHRRTHHDARSVPRVGADHAVELIVAGLPGPIPARSRDLGVGGACLATASPFALKEVRRVRVHLPDGVLELEARGRWQQEAPGEELVLTGVEFVEVPEAALERLWDVVVESGRQLARFVYARSDLRGFGVEEAMGLAQVSRFRHCAAGRWIYRQGSRRAGEESVFMVLEGAVVLQFRVRGVREVPLERLERGRLFGGLPLLSDLPHAESAVAASEVRLLEIDRAAFEFLERAKPWLAERIAHAVVRVHAERLHALLERVADQL